MIIREVKESDVLSVSQLISKTFRTCNYKEGTTEAINRYVNFYDPSIGNTDEIYEQFRRVPISLLAEDNNKIVGIIRGNNDRLINLFVDPNFHGKGYGAQLLRAFEIKLIENGSKVLTIKASLYATAFYQKAGYKKTTGIRNFRGLKIQPMKKTLI